MTGTRWTIAPLGDSALLLEFGDRIDETINDAVHAAAAWIRAQALDGWTDLVPAYASLAVHFDPLVWDADTLAARLACPVNGLPASSHRSRRVVKIPVRYGGDEGPDLGEVAARAGIDPQLVVERHSAPDYRVMFLGFSPGFAYLSGLDESLATPRRSSPRPAVPAGSVGIGGAQTGIYPAATPGGWNLIGRTPTRLFDPSAEPPTLLLPGDRVRFTPVRELRADPPSPPASGSGTGAGFLVEHPGLLSSLQDLGRHGYQHLGVSPGGAVDRFAHRTANLLVGNDERAATLEITMLGPKLVAKRAMTVALCGGAFAATVDGAVLPLWHSVAIREGARIDMGLAGTGARACLAVGGGFDVPLVLGSRSTALRDHFGGLLGRALRKGDELPVGRQVSGWHPVAGAVALRPPAATSAPIRVLPGPHWDQLTAAARSAFLGEPFEASAQSDRMGMRLRGPSLALEQPIECLSAGVATGTIQLPPEGQPIVLLADRQTTGGYPRLGEVASADLPRLAQLRPGDTVRFALCSLAEARAALIERAHNLERIRAALNSRVGDKRL